MSLRTCYGTTQPDDWVQHPTQANQIYVDVDTSACAFAATPIYVCSLVGESHHWSTTGASSIYHPTPNGFRVNLRNAVVGCTDGKCDYEPLTVERARRFQWRINWIATAAEAVAAPEEFGE